MMDQTDKTEQTQQPEQVEQAEEKAEEKKDQPKRTPRPIRHPPNVDMFSASGDDIEEMKQRLFKEAQGRELYFQEYTEEDGGTTLYGYPRTLVLDLIYERAYPAIKLIDDHAQLKVKSNRTVTDFFVIVQTRRSGAFIGKHGSTLDALENIISHMISRVFPRWVSISLDVDNYRRKRQMYLEGMVKRMVRDIERDHRERPVRELLPKERKFIHQFFTDHPYLTTESRGDAKDRTLYIIPRKDIREE